MIIGFQIFLVGSSFTFSNWGTGHHVLKLIMVTCGFILQIKYGVPRDLHLSHIRSEIFKKYGLLNVLTSSFTHLQVVHLFGSVLNQEEGGRACLPHNQAAYHSNKILTGHFLQ